MSSDGIPARVGIVSVHRESRGFPQWLAHHQSVGVHRVFLRFEGEVSPLTAALVKDQSAWVTVLEHDDNPHLSMTFDELAKRCEAFATRVVTSCDTDVEWLVHIGSDELLHCPSRSVGLALADAVAPEAKTVRLDTLEAVLLNPEAVTTTTLLPFGDETAVAFRTPLALQAGVGRAAGRVGAANAARGTGWFTGKPVHYMDSAALVVLQFDCLTLEDWYNKFMARVSLTPLELRRLATEYDKDSVRALQRSTTDTLAHAAVFWKYRTAEGHATLGRPNVHLQQIFFQSYCQPEATTSPCPTTTPEPPQPTTPPSASPLGTTWAPTTTTTATTLVSPTPAPLEPLDLSSARESPPRFSTPVGPQTQPLELPPLQQDQQQMPPPPPPPPTQTPLPALRLASPRPLRQPPGAPPLRSLRGNDEFANAPSSSSAKSARSLSLPIPSAAPSRSGLLPPLSQAPTSRPPQSPPASWATARQQPQPLPQQHPGSHPYYGAPELQPLPLPPPQGRPSRTVDAQQALLFGLSRAGSNGQAAASGPPSPPSSTSGRKPGHLPLLGFTVTERRTAVSARRGGLLF